MKIEKLNLPEKVFGIETGLLIVFAPLLGVILLVMISVNLFLLPRIDDYNNMISQLNTLNDQKQELVQKRAYLLSIDQNELKKNAGYLASSLLPQKNAYLLVGMVSEIVSGYGYQVDSFWINPGNITKKDDNSQVGGVSKIPITLTVIGPSDKYLALVDGLESSLPILSLDNFVMLNDGNTTKLDLMISAYYMDSSATVDINKLTLADLTLTKDESDLVSKLSTFTVLGSAANLEAGFNINKDFVKYDRNDPFNP